MEALAGRLGRRETCIVNAAIMASSWPYRSENKRRYNKAIVVDIDLPVEADGEDRAAGEHQLTSGDNSMSEDATESSEAVS